MKTKDFDYHLPLECIAQTPLEPRDSSRLLVVKRDSGAVEDRIFYEIGTYLKPGDVLVLNQTRVIPARLFGNKALTGGKIEILLIQRLDSFTWKAILAGKNLRPGMKLSVENGIKAEIQKVCDGAMRILVFDRNMDELLSSTGHVPLPPYITTPLADPERYQTVFAQEMGSAAAPTAGLHFTRSLLDQLHQKGVIISTVTLHVGLDTFLPVKEENPLEHKIHTEWCHLSSETAETINYYKANGGRIIAVGTTSVRTLETAGRLAGNEEYVKSFQGSTDLFILPGYEFKIVDAMITNFHLPKSTLIMLVSAFAGRETILDVYQQAIQKGYRFYSFGDAMMIL